MVTSLILLLSVIKQGVVYSQSGSGVENLSGNSGIDPAIEKKKLTFAEKKLNPYPL
jgi:hypothetical protein